MTAEPTSTLLAGTLLAHYEVRSVLGAGGMGTVYLAQDTALDRPVALKVLRPEIAGDPDLRDRFVREARAAARVSHPNLAHVYFVGSADGLPFFAMEYCPGDTLDAVVRRDGGMPLARGLDVLVQAARGLAAAHGAGVIHRDVKPSNLMVLPDGTVKVTDFGLAKSLQADVQATAGRLMGTPTYMSPEQIRGKPADARTDVYLLGLTGWFLFAGKPPYASQQVGEVIHDQMSTPLPPLSGTRPELPPALDDALSRMCAKDPTGRPATMEEAARALESLRPRLLLSAPFVARGVAYAVDWMLVGFVALAIAGVDALLLSRGMPGILMTLVLLVAMGGLLLAPEIRWGTTAGKALLNLGVVRLDGTRPGVRALAARYLLLFPMGLALTPGKDANLWDLIFLALQCGAVGLGVLWYFFTGGRTLSDSLTGTRVVYRLGRTQPAA